MAVNNLGTRARAAQQIRTVVLNTSSATVYDVIADPGDGFRIVIMGISAQANVANLVVTVESASGDDMIVFQAGTGNGFMLWRDAGICAANASEKVTFTHNTSALLTGVLHYIIEEVV